VEQAFSPAVRELQKLALATAVLRQVEGGVQAVPQRLKPVFFEQLAAGSFASLILG
jgi:hypothetical protein